MRSVAFLLGLLAATAVPAEAADPFSGYAEGVRVRAARVVAEASPGREKILVGEGGAVMAGPLLAKPPRWERRRGGDRQAHVTTGGGVRE